MDQLRCVNTPGVSNLQRDRCSEMLWEGRSSGKREYRQKCGTLHCIRHSALNLLPQSAPFLATNVEQENCIVVWRVTALVILTLDGFSKGRRYFLSWGKFLFWRKERRSRRVTISCTPHDCGGVMYTKTNARVGGSNSQLSLFVPHVGTSLPTRTRLKKSQCIDPTWSLKLTPAFYNLGPTMALSSPQLFKVPVIGGTIF